MSGRGWPTVVLAAAAVLLSALIGLELAGDPRPAIPRAAAPEGDLSGKTPGLGETQIAFSPMASYVEMVERPLFSATRRPVEAEEDEAVAEFVPPEPPPLRPNELVIVGVVMRPEGTVALIQDTRTDEVVNAAEGARVGGWEVAEIQADRVILRSRGQEATLQLYRSDEAEAQGLPPRYQQRRVRRRRMRGQTRRSGR
jgi:hypothetical protein